MTHRKFTVALLALTLAALVLFGGGMYLLDPLVRYRSEEEGILSYYTYGAAYTNPGLAANYTYDTVLVGTSMMENTSAAECNALFGADAVKMTHAGGTARNMYEILSVAFRSENEIARVFWCMDEFQLSAGWDELQLPFPDFLYRADHKEDLSYLLNADLAYHYLAKPLYYSLCGETQSARAPEDYWSWRRTFGRETVLANFQPKPAGPVLARDAYHPLVTANLTENILPLVTAHPETEFVFFFPPYSMLYWYDETQRGVRDAELQMLFDFADALLDYENVKIYFFQDDTSITTDLGYYRDYSHYHKDINSYMLQKMAEDTCRLTRETYQDVLTAFETMLKTFDFDAFLAG